ncbi:hypothetical protein SPONN_492 [uncultured Candidatus Thioglobus sp.]|nr:hypothetical protein SPONN_492 [uncultured Candidatus Thioglobus sp.]
MCITRFVDARISDGDCLNVVTQLTLLYQSDNSLESISTRVSLFPVFCRQGCGQVIVDAWQACNAFDEIEPLANLLIGMCASNAGRTCYSTFSELISVLNDGVSCSDALDSTGSCSSECSAGTRDGVTNFGCCVNVVIAFQDDMNTGDVEAEFDTLFFQCGVTRPAPCANRFNIPPPSSLPPSSQAPPTNPPPSSATSLTALLPVALLCSAAALI